MFIRQEFKACETSDSHQTVHLLKPVVAEIIRWIGISMNGGDYPCMRVDLRGEIVNERRTPHIPGKTY